MINLFQLRLLVFKVINDRCEKEKKKNENRERYKKSEGKINRSNPTT